MERTYASGDAQVKSRKPKTGRVALGKASLKGTVKGCTVARPVRVLGHSGHTARIISAGKSPSIGLSATREIGYPSGLNPEQLQQPASEAVSRATVRGRAVWRASYATRRLC